MLNLIKDNEIIRQVLPGSRFDLPDGTAVFGATLDWPGHDGYTLVQAPPSPEPEPPTPEEIRANMPPLQKWRFETVLDNNNLQTAVTAAIGMLPQDERNMVMNKRLYSQEFFRTDPLFDALSSALGMTPEQVDNLWNEGLAL